MDYIQVENLQHIYSQGSPYEACALTDVSFSIKKGEFIGLIGHTGSGKSTLIQHLNGLIKPTSGKILLDGVDITSKGVSMMEIRKKIGLVFQYPEYQLFEETIHKDVAFGPLNLGCSEEETLQRVREALELVGLDYETISHRSPFELSGGQKRRVAIAGVLAMKPEVLILDEPTAGLDPRAHKDILNMLQKIHRDQGTITILVSHNMDDIARLSNKIFVMEKGRLVLQGTPEEVFSQSDMLDSIGLALPPTTSFLNVLKAKHKSVNIFQFTVEETLGEILKFLNEKGTA